MGNLRLRLCIFITSDFNNVDNTGRRGGLTLGWLMVGRCTGWYARYYVQLARVIQLLYEGATIDSLKIE